MSKEGQLPRRKKFLLQSLTFTSPITLEWEVWINLTRALILIGFQSEEKMVVSAIHLHAECKHGKCMKYP